MQETGVRPAFWLAIAAAVAILVLVLMRYWEWAIVAFIAAVVASRLPFLRRAAPKR